ALSAAALPSVFGETVKAAVPDSLVAKTCGLVADWSAGAAVPVSVLRLAQGGFSMRTTLLLGALTLALTAAGAVLASRPDDPAKPDDPPVVKAEQPAAKEEPVVVAVPDPKGEEKAAGFT